MRGWRKKRKTKVGGQGVERWPDRCGWPALPWWVEVAMMVVGEHSLN
jgi:hypothetical protein